MFGHDDHDQKDQTNDNVVMPSDDSSTPVTDTPSAVPDLPVIGNDQTDAPMDNAGPATSAPTDQPDNTPPLPAASPADDDLISLKKQALQQLQPLVGHLDQSPEEKFKTTMMMIQAADDKTLVQTAYEAAQQISDEKTRAQALLDVINEINYFTHPQDQ